MHEKLNTDGIDLSGFLHYMKEPGTASDNASISKVFTQLGVNDMMLEYVMNIIPVANFIRSRYQATPIDLNTLLALPSDSFGHQWATFMQANHLNPHFFQNLQEHDDRSYLINRLHDTHDMWHIILDFDTSEAGEAGMNAFTYAQSGSPTTCMLMAAKLVRAIGGSDENRYQMMTNICRGYQLGMTAQPFLAIAWEENWSTKLSDLRKLAGIKP
jgi:ubiquinone biosynthesis protein Coq4